MRGRLRGALALIACLALAACQNAIDLTITGGPDQPVIAISSGMRFPTARPCVDHITVYREHPQASPDSIWSVAAADQKCLDVRWVTYGETPSGFEVSKPAQPLRAKEVYEVVVTGSGWIGSQRIVWRDGRYQTLGADGR